MIASTRAALTSRRARRWLSVAVVLAVFAAVLTWWSREGVVGDPPADLRAIVNSASVAAPSPASSGPLAGDSYEPGDVLVVFRATGDATIGVVAYRVQGERETKRIDVHAPMTAAVSVPAGKHVAMVVQVAPGGHTASCSIAVNGVIKVTRTAHGPYRVVGCLY